MSKLFHVDFLLSFAGDKEQHRTPNRLQKDVILFEINDGSDVKKLIERNITNVIADLNGFPTSYVDVSVINYRGE